MKNYLAGLTIFAAMLGLAAPASAIVMNGSTYSVYLQGTTSGNPFLAVTTFDRVAAAGDRNGQTITLSESETALSATSSLISIKLGSDSDLFPALDDVAVLGINDGLDFLAEVVLDDARLTFRNMSGAVIYASDNLASLTEQNMPWDGTFPSSLGAIGIDDIGAMGIVNISFDFTVHEMPANVPVPEPGSMLLCGFGLLALAGAHRRRRHV